MSLVLKFRRLGSIVRKSTNVLFGKHLMVTNVALSVGLSTFGDAIQQRYSKGIGGHWDVRQSGHMGAAGASVGWCCHHWYNYLDNVLPGRSSRILIKKILVDQVIFSPIIILVFFVTVGVLERETFASITSEFVEKGKKLYTAEWFIWPPAQFVNFYFVPTRFRVLYDNTISLGFDIYTSSVKYGSTYHSRSPTGFELVALEGNDEK
ncbi:unnamed protein product [Notodromas monacha]|uniref:Mpv17-like protein 2 n=1 Tax=Notodromas monacha TaxID=399045 RepID=A0A7R9GA19_9CRUS|nr:unnamed protein product [Notodromas monacha]CAD7285022.1 unnamed protein product [Notodromas monacha]CAG0913668.1 unnamed protein product [Notodromas monacha]CAG0925174.1 unnamed protein product [Notodromas monacha]